MRQDDRQPIETTGLGLMQLYGDDGTPVLERVHIVIKAYAALHATVTNKLYEMEKKLRNGESKAHDEIHSLEFTILKACHEIPLPGTANLIEVALYRYNNNHVTNLQTDIFYILLEAVKEGKQMMLYKVDDKNVEFYKNPTYFGHNIESKFPDAQRDLIEAGTCYALGCPTASVMHLMRALEALLQALANAIPGLTLKPKDTMGEIVKKVTNWATRLQDETHAEIERKRRISTAAMHFQNITNALRNPTMHTGEFYSLEDTNTALVCAKLFVCELADII